MYQNDGKGSIKTFPTITTGIHDEQLDAFLRQFNNLVILIDSDRNFQNETFEVVENLELTPKNIKAWLLDFLLSNKHELNFDDYAKFINSFKLTDEGLKANSKNLPFSKEIALKKTGHHVEVMMKNDNITLPIGSFGTGIQQLFYLLTKVFSSTSKVVLIEEFELNLSKKYQIELIKFLATYLADQGKQLFFTTHSPYITEVVGTINSHYLAIISGNGKTTITHEVRGDSGFRDWLAE